MQPRAPVLPLPPSVRVSRVARTAVAIATGALVLLLCLGIGTGFPHSLDAGWGEVLAWGISHGAQWGKDLVFTYGPLGFMARGLPFDPATYWPTLILQLVFATATAVLVAVDLRRLPLAAALAFAVTAIVFGPSWATSSSFIIVYPLVAVALEQVARRTDAARLARHAAVAGLAAFAALMPLIKFSSFPLWLVWLPLGLVILRASGDRRLLATFAVASIVAPVAVWIACGQHPANLGAWLYWSWQIAVAYPAAMRADPVLPITDWITLGATACWLAAIAAWAWRVRRSPRRVALYVLIAAAMVLAYRAGATRADNGHLAIVWSVYAWSAALLAGLGCEDTRARGLRQSTAVFVLVMVILTLALPRLSRTYSSHTLGEFYSGRLTASYATAQLRELLHPVRGYQTRYRTWMQDRTALALPLIKQTVGHGTIDALLNAQSALLANGLNYRPRPVFQSYSAYSGELAELNARFFLSPRAPQWVMLNWTAISGDYPTSEDPRALLRILQDYRPVLTERNYVLFRRRGAPPAPAATAGRARDLPVRFANATPIPASMTDAWFARFDVRLTPYGKVEAALFRPPKFEVEARLRDGGTRTYTVTPAIARSGFVLSPALNSNADYLAWQHGDRSFDVTTLQPIQREVFNHRAFRIDGPLRLYPVTLPRGAPYTRALYGALYPGFNQLPTAVTGSTRTYTVDHQPVLFLPVPGTLTFDLPAGTYAVSARYGLMPNALTNAACLAAHADGVGFRVEVTNGTQPPVTTYLDPFKDPAQRYAADYSGTLTVAAGERVTVGFTRGKADDNGACDWSWIRDLKFVAQQAAEGTIHRP